MDDLTFKQTAALTFGVELELQLINTRDCDLTRGASDLLALVERKPHPGEIELEITESMLELSTSIHTRHGDLLDTIVNDGKIPDEDTFTTQIQEFADQFEISEHLRVEPSTHDTIEGHVEVIDGHMQRCRLRNGCVSWRGCIGRRRSIRCGCRFDRRRCDRLCGTWARGG